MKKLESLYTAVEDVQKFSHQKIVCQLLRKLNIKLIYDPAILLLRYIYQRTENRYLKNKYRYRQVQSSTIHNSQNVETQTIIHKLINA